MEANTSASAVFPGGMEAGWDWVNVGKPASGDGEAVDPPQAEIRRKMTQTSAIRFTISILPAKRVIHCRGNHQQEDRG